MPPSPVQFAIRDGNYPIIYIVTDAGLEKYFYEAGRVERMKSVEAGEQGHMVGYAGLDVPLAPATGFELIVLPFAATGSADHVWHYTEAAGWTAKPVPVAGRKWRGIIVARSNAQRWLMWGDTNPSSTNANSITSRAGLMVGVGDEQPAFWQSSDAGATWSAYPVPTGINTVNDTSLNKDQLLRQVHATFTTASDHIAIGAVTRGQDEDQFNRPLHGITIWRNGAQIWSSAQTLAAPSLTGFGHGADDDILAAGIFNTASGGTTEYRFGYVPTNSSSWSQVGSDYDNGIPTDYTGDYALTFTTDPGSRRAIAIQGHGNGPQEGTLLTPDYRSAMFQEATPNIARLQNTIPNAIAWSAAGIYAAGAHDLSTGTGPDNEGLLAINPTTNTATELFMSYSLITGLTTARQKTQTTVAARLDGSPHSSPAAFGVFNGISWSTIPGPADAPGAQLANVLAVIER